MLVQLLILVSIMIEGRVTIIGHSPLLDTHHYRTAKQYQRKRLLIQYRYHPYSNRTVGISNLVSARLD